MFIMLQQIKYIFYNLIVLYLTRSQTFILLVSESSIDLYLMHIYGLIYPQICDI